MRLAKVLREYCAPKMLKTFSTSQMCILVYVYKTHTVVYIIVTYVCYKRVSDNTDVVTCVCVMDVGMVKEILGTYKIQYHPEEDNPDKVCISIP